MAHPPVLNITEGLMRSPLREGITAGTRLPETQLLPVLLEQARPTPEQAAQTQTLAMRLAQGVRERALAGGRAGLVQGLLQEFALSSAEGVALMCMAEALLRIPDGATRDALIRDKIAQGNWQQHLGQSQSVFVNAASWGLLLTGKLVATHSARGLSTALRQVIARGGEPLIRKGVDMAMRMLGEQFVTGETIAEALVRAREREAMGFRYSYDMLGEAALTQADAKRYAKAYADAIHAIGQASGGRGVYEGPGISIKLSALHPRYSRAQVARVKAQLYPVLMELATLARSHDIGLNIDAEESDRLELSLDLLETLSFEPALQGWQGLGFVVQAYQKRCPAVLDAVIDLARRSRRRLMVRLVKGAYWDSEIKRAQLDGLDGYPVYTRKPYTDVAYLACARRLLAAPDAVFAQFATHNAHTLAAIHSFAGPQNSHQQQYEFQCLHGMGEPLYEQLVPGGAPGLEPAMRRPCRVYAPVGTHDTLLAYLVRRLLENGANSSFVNRIADENLSLQELLASPVDAVEAWARSEGAIGLPHPAIAAPAALLGVGRQNSQGLDLASEHTLDRLQRALHGSMARRHGARPMLARSTLHDTGSVQGQEVCNPADAQDVVGTVLEAQAADVATAVDAARQGASVWAAWPVARRAQCLLEAAASLQRDALSEESEVLPLLVREAGKSWANAVAEVREAVDFLRYCAQQILSLAQSGPLEPLGVVVCISPWNFPLAIFTGQVAAALATGNTVLAKPAEQTPLVAALVVRFLHEAGVPQAALQLLPGRGETVGAALVAHPAVQAVVFTGSTAVARLLQAQLAQRLDARGQPVTLVAETGGQNVLFVDSSALAEQAVADIAASAFDSAGQRCSALRLLCVQQEVAERVIEMLKGAVSEWQVGDPRWLNIDIGPVIDSEARDAIESHVERCRSAGLTVWRASARPHPVGSFVAPTVIELPSGPKGLSSLGAEVFGPVLHVLRYAREELPGLLQAVADTGYGLTQGVHTRIDETAAMVVQASHAGNLYVNRTIVGAVVGVQPFGGEGLSGTGPKAGGPLYLLRLLSQCPSQAARLAVVRSGAPAELPLKGLPSDEAWQDKRAALLALRGWAQQHAFSRLTAVCDQAAAESPLTGWIKLPGPTGEANLYAVWPRGLILCTTEDHPGAYSDRLTQLAAVLAAGGQALWPASASPLAERLPPTVREHVTLARDWQSAGIAIAAALHHGGAATTRKLAQDLARRPGPIVTLTALAPGEVRVPLERLVTERSLSINTAAAGGNASLMTLA